MKIPLLTPGAVRGKVVAVRVDFNVPVKDGVVLENTRIVESIPTLKFLLKHQAKRVHIFSHLGRPKGKKVSSLSLRLVVSELESLLKSKVEFRGDYTAGTARVQIHENVRFHEGERNNDPGFIQKLLGCGAEVFVNDGFAVSHRPHASVVGMASFLPSYPGFLLQKEIDALSPFLKKERVPGLAIVVGGAKIDTKVDVLKYFAGTAENILIGGAIASTFLAAEGFDVGESFYQEDKLDIAREILGIADKNNTGVHLPVDVVCAENMNDVESVKLPVEDVMGNMRIFDIGPHSIASYKEILCHAQTIIWNGPMGIYEKKCFESGTREILKVITSQKSAKTVLGGGDTLEALKKFGVEKNAFTHVSTGGGAMLEFLEGKELPGIEVLRSRH